MASKIRLLVPYYVGPDTVYDGTTNIVMLTTNGLWATLQIGDKTNKFTCTPAMGTNAATYGDNPWRICIEDLLERYMVLNALKVNNFSSKLIVTNQEVKQVYYYSSYEDAVTAFNAASWISGGSAGYGQQYGMFVGNSWGSAGLLLVRSRGNFLILGGYPTNIPIEKIEAYAYLNYVGIWMGGDIAPGASNTYHKIVELASPTEASFPFEDSEVYGDSSSPPLSHAHPPHYDYNWNIARADFYSPPGSVGTRGVLVFWNFNYCTVEY